MKSSIDNLFAILGVIAFLVMLYREWPETKRYLMSTNGAYCIAYLFRGLNRFQKYAVIVLGTGVMVFDAWLLGSLSISDWEALGAAVAVLNLFVVFITARSAGPKSYWTTEQ
jgi:hypothetical protein